jgi:beta-galactosidase
MELARVRLNESAKLSDLLTHPISSEHPATMEALGQDYGFILYRKHLDRPAKGTLDIAGVHDYAVVYQGDHRLGVLDRRLKQHAVEIELGSSKPLDIVVENLGRINFGLKMMNDRKGIVGKVTFSGEEWTGWEIYPLPMTDLSALKFSTSPKHGPAFYRGTLEVTSPGDTFLDLREWGKGFVLVNGHSLGRYWHIGPQQSIFLPATVLKKGKNEIVIFDLEDNGHRYVEGRQSAIFETRVARDQH